MAKITYVEADGAAHVIDVTSGFSVMEGAVKNGVPGILADCGGNCACGTCRVFVDDAWLEKTGEASEMEEGMLEILDTPGPSERLACQITVTEELDGLIVRMPKTQF